MKSCNYYVTKEDAEGIEAEISFISGKAGVTEDRAVELIKIKLLSDILQNLEAARQNIPEVR